MVRLDYSKSNLFLLSHRGSVSLDSLDDDDDDVIVQNAYFSRDIYFQWRNYYRSVILAAKRKQEGSHWSKSRALFSKGNTALAPELVKAEQRNKLNAS